MVHVSDNSRVLVTGSSGLVGKGVVDLLRERGADIIRLRHSTEPVDAPDLAWDPLNGVAPPAEALEGLDAVIHLAGENIAAGRWTPARKARIRDSRVQGTALLAQALAACENRPKVLICASAIGFYGNRGDELLTEESKRGSGFLAYVCRDWEDAALEAQQAGIRVVFLRIGMILSKEAGVLQKMVPPFKAGVGGPLGRGQNYYSWIHLQDVLETIRFALDRPDLSGPVNVTAPEPVRSREFTQALARVLHRPHLLPLPPALLRLMFGEMVDGLMTASLRVQPSVLEKAGFEFTHPALEDALREELKPKQQPS